MSGLSIVRVESTPEDDVVAACFPIELINFLVLSLSRYICVYSSNMKVYHKCVPHSSLLKRS